MTTTKLAPHEVYECEKCHARWWRWLDSSGWSLAHGYECGPCCDNDPGFPETLMPVSKIRGGQ